MRLIDLDAVDDNIPPPWRIESRKAQDEVKALPVAERAKAINRLQKIWKGLKPVLHQVSGGKCWYCESSQTRSDKAVDHFRPKNRVLGGDDTEGYWWLAFEWRNYRYSCTFCNSHRVSAESSGGKQDHFPIAANACRGLPEASPDELDVLEQPLLLDPTKPSDVLLLTFEVQDGMAIERCLEKDKLEHKRAQISIALYHLNENDLRVARYRKMKNIKNLVREAEATTVNNPRYEACMRELFASVRPSAEYSVAARTMLRSLSGESAIARLVLEEA